jgi:hypothetical protein
MSKLGRCVICLRDAELTRVQIRPLIYRVLIAFKNMSGMTTQMIYTDDTFG